ncbi:MAG: UDP-N-acetylmuramoyl-L-alanine--D-glutamate ligase [candidate division SR1 bacterium CG_4_9_14_3_um_filter_40_9]|nr:MAG: UDP-N-acetylmuramoyl-L-alanine--D-glutamate ligase [candidate division SR1 bacterium CG_4_9_14_3_um_filter_40_9]
MQIADLKDKNIAILGFGLEGKSTLNFLMNQNAQFKSITILDVNQHLQTSSLVGSVTGDEYLERLDQYDIIFKSAGIPMGKKLFLHKDKIITQIQFFFDNYKGRVIAVTATKGKSTIVSLIFHILKDAGYRVKLVGNIGNPVLDEIDFLEEFDYVVLELSSYMLDTLKKQNYISVLGSVFPDHLDRHGSFQAYAKAKLNVLNGSEYNVAHRKTIQECKLGEQLIAPSSSSNTHLISYGSEGKYKRYYGFFMEDDKKLFSENDRNILGEHNLDNICAALAVGDVIGLPLKTVHQSIKTFKGLPHRMENFGIYGGRERVDDAISTTPESTIQAIKTFGKKIDTIFLGGTDRGYNFNELIKCILEYKIRNIVLFPDSGKKILELLKEHIEKYTDISTADFKHCIQVQYKHGNHIDNLKIFSTDDMQAAVKFAYMYTEKGKMALLSTASPSYSVWKNFEEKGDLFKKYVKELLDG